MRRGCSPRGTCCGAGDLWGWRPLVVVLLPASGAALGAPLYLVPWTRRRGIRLAVAATVGVGWAIGVGWATGVGLGVVGAVAPDDPQDSHVAPVDHPTSHRVSVMYQGEIVEQGDAAKVTANPDHPNTQRLLLASPVPDPDRQAERRAARQAQVRLHEGVAA